MNSLSITIDGNQMAFRPGETVRGTIRWLYESRPGRIELRLIWFTEGPGPDDVGVVDTLTQEDAFPSDSRMFQFRLPSGPFSYNGNSFRVWWSLELTAPARKDCTRLELVVSPSLEPIILPYR